VSVYIALEIMCAQSNVDLFVLVLDTVENLLLEQTISLFFSEFVVLAFYSCNFSS